MSCVFAWALWYTVSNEILSLTFMHTSLCHWQVAFISPLLASGLALWLLWSIDYMARDVLGLLSWTLRSLAASTPSWNTVTMLWGAQGSLEERRTGTLSVWPQLSSQLTASVNHQPYELSMADVQFRKASRLSTRGPANNTWSRKAPSGAQVNPQSWKDNKMLVVSKVLSLGVLFIQYITKTDSINVLAF